MDEFFGILSKLVPIIIAVVYFIATKGRNGDEEETDPEAAERARKIQEEIRRKILQRQGDAAPQQERESTIVLEEPETEWQDSYEMPPPLPKPIQEETPPIPDPSRELERENPSDAYERRRLEIAAELEKANQLRKQAFGRERGRPATSRKSKPKEVLFGGSMRDALSNPQSVRRAFVLKEILDTPVGLR